MSDDYFRCIFCGGDPFEPDHDAHCDGRQGGRDDEPPVTLTRITAPRDTSIAAFYNAVTTGVIKTRQQQVWTGLKACPSSTAGEVFAYLKEERHLGLRYDSNTCARFTELRDLGLIRETGERPCRVTTKTCLTWEVVPVDEYAGPAIVHRCPTCRQIVSRDVPTLVKT